MYVFIINNISWFITTR